MKLKEIGSTCKRAKHITLRIHPDSQGDGVIQFIGNGYALYAVDGLPRLTKESALSIFDVPPDDRADYCWNEADLDGLAENNATDYQVEREYASVIVKGNEYLAFNHEGDIVFIKAAALKPILDEMEDIEFLCRNDGKHRAILAMRGMELRALICETRWADHNADAVDSIAAISRGASSAYFEANKQKKAGELNQLSMEDTAKEGADA
jgi:hypothetical protein